MTLSIWRLSHLLLAISASVFLLIASVTGAILSFEPINNRSHNFSTEQVEELTVAEVIDTLQSNYLEVIALERDDNDFFSAQVLTNDGEFQTFYVDLTTGKKTGDIIEQSDFFAFITTLHRSLFLDSLGRFFIGICACLLILLAISGIILIFKRLNSFRSFVKKIENAHFFQYAHITLGRLLFIPLLIISITGSYLFLQRIGVFPEVTPIEHSISFNSTTSYQTPKEIAVFKETKIAQLKSLEFPFSPDEEDYFLLKTDKKEIAIHQYSGKILSSKNYPFPALISRLSLDLHTGKSNRLWAIILFVSAISIPFFIISGFALSIKRWKGKLKNTHSPKESEIILLFGSENGGTKQKALSMHKALLQAGKKSYIASLNDFQDFPTMEHLVILTSTYGTGNAPENASKFLKQLKTHFPKHSFDYSIVGFGSHAYPDFCQFAEDCNNQLTQSTNNHPFVPLHKIHNQSNVQFSQWVNDWSRKMQVQLPPLVFNKSQLRSNNFTVLSKTEATELSGDSFTLQLLPESSQSFQSGDLLAILPPKETQERLYSIGKTLDKTVLLSIKKHERGICSTYLHDLNVGDMVAGRIQKNHHFHLKKTSKEIIFIANGTGMAPFIGMLNESEKVISKIYWGGKTHHSFALYKSLIEEKINIGQLKEISLAYSREGTKEYVWHLIKKDASFIASHLKNKGLIYVCGSLQMEKDVLRILEEICNRELSKPLSHYRQKGRIYSDCY